MYDQSLFNQAQASLERHEIVKRANPPDRAPLQPPDQAQPPAPLPNQAPLPDQVPPDQGPRIPLWRNPIIPPRDIVPPAPPPGLVPEDLIRRANQGDAAATAEVERILHNWAVQRGLLPSEPERQDNQLPFEYPSAANLAMASLPASITLGMMGAGLGGATGSLTGLLRGNTAEGLGRGIFRGGLTGAGLGGGLGLGAAAGSALSGGSPLGIALGSLLGGGVGGLGGYALGGKLLGSPVGRGTPRKSTKEAKAASAVLALVKKVESPKQVKREAITKLASTLSITKQALSPQLLQRAMQSGMRRFAAGTAAMQPQLLTAAQSPQGYRGVNQLLTHGNQLPVNLSAHPQISATYGVNPGTTAPSWGRLQRFSQAVESHYPGALQLPKHMDSSFPFSRELMRRFSTGTQSPNWWANRVARPTLAGAPAPGSLQGLQPSNIGPSATQYHGGNFSE
jgi:hypothetical protein